MNQREIPCLPQIHGGHLEIVKLLVEKRVDISIKYSGSSMKDMDAYAFAMERGETAIAEYLLEYEGESRV